MEIILIIAVVVIIFGLRIPDTLGKWLIPIFRKKKTEIKNTIEDINRQAAKSDIEIQFDEAQKVLSRIRILRYDTGKSIGQNSEKIKKLDSAAKTATNNQLPTDILLKRKQDVELIVNDLQEQLLHLSSQEEKIRTVVERLNIDGLLTNSDLDNLSKNITQSIESLENIKSQYPQKKSL